MQCLFMRGVHSKAAGISKSRFLNHYEDSAEREVNGRTPKHGFLEPKTIVIRENKNFISKNGSNRLLSTSFFPQ